MPTPSYDELADAPAYDELSDAPAYGELSDKPAPSLYDLRAAEFDAQAQPEKPFRAPSSIVEALKEGWQSGNESAANSVIGLPARALALLPRLKAQAVQDAMDVLTPGLPLDAQSQPPSLVAQRTAGVVNVGRGVADSLVSPLGVATLGIGGAPAIAQRAVSGAFLADMAASVPELARTAGEASVSGTPQERVEAYGNLATVPAFAAGIGLHALAPRAPVTPETFPKLPDPDTVARNIAAPGTLRPQELQAVGLDRPQEPPFSIGELPFDAARRFGNFEVPAPDILPRMGRLNEPIIDAELRAKEELETRGKVSFGAPAPELLRQAQISRAELEAIEGAQAVGLTRTAKALEDAKNARTIRESAPVPESEVRAPVDEGTPLRQQGEAPKESVPAAAEVPPKGQEVISSIQNLPDAEAGVLKQKPAVEAGMKLTAADVPALEAARDAAMKQAMDAIEKGDENGFKSSLGRNIWFSGAIEGANRKGPNYDQFIKDTAKAAEPAKAAPAEVPARQQAVEPAEPAPKPPIEPPVAFAQTAMQKPSSIVRVDSNSLFKDRGNDFSAGRMMREQFGDDWKNGKYIFVKDYGLELRIDKPELNHPSDIQHARDVAELVKQNKPLDFNPTKQIEASAAPDLVQRLEQIRDRFDASGDMGKSMSLPHPDAFKAIGKSIIYSAVDLAIQAVKAGRAIGDAITLALDHVRKNYKGTLNEKELRANLDYLVKNETKPNEKAKTQTQPGVGAAGEQVVPNVSEGRLQGDPNRPTTEVPTITQRIGNAITRAKDFVTIDPIPKLTRAMGGDNASAIQHASARVAVPRMIDDMLAKVFPDQYKNPEAMTATMDVLNKDNILGGYDAFIERAADAQQAGDMAAAKKWRGMANEVAKSHDLVQLAADVQAAKANPEISANIQRWNETVNPELDQLYNELKGMDANTPREGRGRVFGARVNLLPKVEEARWVDSLNDEAKPMPSPSSSSYRNPNVKRDKFDRQAKFTGQYSDNPAAVLANVLSHRWNEVTKVRFINDMVEKGAASWEKPADGTINGKEAKPLPVKVPETETTVTDGVALDGRTKQVEKTLWVPQDTVSDIRGVLDTDLRLQQNPAAKVLTGLQLAQLADAVTHTKNLHSVIANAQGTKALWSDVTRKMPFLSTADSAVRITKVLYDISRDTPEIRAEMAEMAKNGMLRQHFPATGIQKITKMQDMIHHVDTAARVIMNRFYDNLVERDLAKPDMASRRAFVQQVGEYNKRLMSPMMQTMSRAGVSPFIVAGRNFNRFGKRTLTGNPGFEVASNKAALQARLVNFTTLGSLFVLPMMVNSVLTGDIFGRKGTPVGAIDLNQPEDDKGNHKVLDLASLYGVRRGMRATGVDAIVSGLQEGKTRNQIVDRAIMDATSTAAHPWMGPALGAGYSTLTGSRLDLRGGPTPIEARKAGPGESQIGENARVALKNQNPLLYAPLRPLFNDTEESYGKDIGKDFLRAPGSSVGLRDVKSPALKKAQELSKFTGQIASDAAERSKERRELAKSVKAGDEGPLRQAYNEGKLDKAQADLVLDRAELAPIQYTVKHSLNAKDAFEVWRLGTPTEQKQLEAIVRDKIRRSKTLSDEDVKRMAAELNKAPKPAGF